MRRIRMCRTRTLGMPRGLRKFMISWTSPLIILLTRSGRTTNYKKSSRLIYNLLLNGFLFRSGVILFFFLGFFFLLKELRFILSDDFIPADQLFDVGHIDPALVIFRQDMLQKSVVFIIVRIGCQSGVSLKFFLDGSHDVFQRSCTFFGEGIDGDLAQYRNAVAATDDQFRFFVIHGFQDHATSAGLEDLV